MSSELILFDLDGTLYPLEERDFLKSSVYSEMRQRSINFLVMRLNIDYEKAVEVYEDVLLRYSQDLSLGFEKEYGLPRTEYFNFAWDIDVAKHIPRDEAVKRLITRLSKKYSLVLISDAPQIWISKVLDHLGLSAYFKEVFHGEGDVRKKSGQYSRILNKYCLSPSQVFMVGDQEKTDVAIPKNLGIKTIFLGDIKSVEADFTVGSLLAIEPILLSDKLDFIKEKHNFVIGALHFSPLIGYGGYLNYSEILTKAKQDLYDLEAGGVDAIIVENNYNLPHKIKETPAVREMMKNLTREIVKISKLPIGISLLWNDFEGALSMAKETGAKFVRVPVFVDSVKTSFGEIIANSTEVISFRDKLNAKAVLIFADIHVKHAEMLDKTKTIEQSAKEAVEQGADAVIVTGKWTGDAPILSDLSRTREAVGSNFPIIIGSGADKNNIQKLFEFADGAIVSTSLKEGESKSPNIERNLKPYHAKFDVVKIKEFMGVAKTNFKRQL